VDTIAIVYLMDRPGLVPAAKKASRSNYDEQFPAGEAILLSLKCHLNLVLSRRLAPDVRC
jgi:hypothetical protein